MITAKTLDPMAPENMSRADLVTEVTRLRDVISLYVEAENDRAREARRRARPVVIIENGALI